MTFLLTLVGGSSSAHAQFTLAGRTTYPVGQDPYGTVVADFDKNGLPDLAVVNGSTSTVSIYLQQVGGTFTQETGSPITVGDGPNHAVVADFNGDTYPDLAVSNYVGGGVRILLRQSTGGFIQGLGSPHALTAGAGSIAIGDFNGDLKTDLVVSLPMAGAPAAMLLRNESGFASASTLGVGNARYVAVADFNGDGKQDLALADNTASAVRILLATTNAGFVQENQPIPVGAGPAVVIAKDFNADGRIDFAVTSFDAAQVAVFLRTPSNNGFSATAGSPFTVAAGPVGLADGDFDLDGRTDLAVASNTAGALTLLKGDGAGAFAVQSPLTGLALAYAVAVADFDGNGTADLALTQSATAGTVSVFLNQLAAQVDAGPEGGAPDASSTDDGGSPPLGDAGPSSGDGGTSNATTADDDEGCSCRSAGEGGRGGLALPPLAFAALALVRYARRRTSTSRLR